MQVFLVTDGGVLEQVGCRADEFMLPASATLLVNMAKYSPYSDSINILTLSFSSFVNVSCKMNLGHVALSLRVRAEKDVH